MAGLETHDPDARDQRVAVLQEQGSLEHLILLDALETVLDGDVGAVSAEVPGRTLQDQPLGRTQLQAELGGDAARSTARLQRNRRLGVGAREFKQAPGNRVLAAHGDAGCRPGAGANGAID